MSMTALQLAEYTIRRATSSDVPITNLKLQKTLYYLQGYSLRALNDPAFNEAIRHWQYGPVVPTVYFAYSANGAEPLCVNDTIDVPALTKAESRLYDKVIDKCLSMSARDLVSKTHQEDPWKQTKDRDTIPQEEIRKFFCHANPLELE